MSKVGCRKLTATQSYKVSVTSRFNICINSKNELIDSKGISFIIDSQIGVLSEGNTLVQLEQVSGGMSTIVAHSLGVSKALQDGDREGMNSQPRSHSVSV